jgi:NAD(P)H dehydrogenase (quinone)
MCAKILVEPEAHISRSYELTGPELKDADGFADDYAATPGRPVRYAPQDLASWIERYVDQILATRAPPVANQFKIITRLLAADVMTLSTINLSAFLGADPTRSLCALKRYPGFERH